MKNIKWLIFGLCLLAAQVGAVVIEGVTPSGRFKTVFVTEAGRLPIEVSTGSVSHVVVDSGTITAFQGGSWFVSTAGTTTVTVSPVTTSSQINAQFTVTAIESNCYPADPLRKQGVICNSSETANIFVGGSGVTSVNGALLGPGACYSPDSPSSFIGAINCISTTSASGFYIYGK